MSPLSQTFISLKFIDWYKRHFIMQARLYSERLYKESRLKCVQMSFYIDLSDGKGRRRRGPTVSSHDSSS